MNKELEDQKRASLERIKSGGEDHVFLVGDFPYDLASYFKKHGVPTHHCSLLEYSDLFAATFPDVMAFPRILVIVRVGGRTATALIKDLRLFIEPLGRLFGADPRVVLVGCLEIASFQQIRNLLFSHVVDWVPSDLPEEDMTARLAQAWEKVSFRRQLLGLGKVSGKPEHVVSHHLDRLNMAERYRLDSLTTEECFQDAVKLKDGEAPWSPPLDALMLACRWRMRDSPGAWERAFGLDLGKLAKLQKQGIRGQEDRLLLLRFWCVLLASSMEGMLSMSRTDLRELQEFIHDVNRDFLAGGLGDAF